MMNLQVNYISDLAKKVSELIDETQRIGTELDKLTEANLREPKNDDEIAQIPLVIHDAVRGQLEVKLRKWEIACLFCGGVALALAAVLLYVCNCI